MGSFASQCFFQDPTSHESWMERGWVCVSHANTAKSVFAPSAADQPGATSLEEPLVVLLNFPRDGSTSERMNFALALLKAVTKGLVVSVSP